MMYREIIAVCSQIYTKHINTLCVLNVQLLGAFVKLRNPTISFVMAVRPSVWNNSARTGRIFTKFNVCVHFENLLSEFKSHQNLTMNNDTLHEDLRTFLVPRSVLLILRNISDQSYRENRNTRFMFNFAIFFSKIELFITEWVKTW